MLQDPNVERYIKDAIKPLKKELSELRSIIMDLKKDSLCNHEMKKVKAPGYPYKPIRCVKCGYEP